MAVYKCSGKDRLDEYDHPICNYESPKPWRGRCPKCHGAYAAIRVGADRIVKQVKTAVSEIEPIEYLPTGVEGFDKVIGGGLISGCVYLFGGVEGAGKTTLALMAADGMAKTRTVVFASAEMSDNEIIRYCQRIGVTNGARIKILGNTPNVHSIIEFCSVERAVMCIFDSIQMMVFDKEANIGSIAQGEQVANYIRQHCKRTGMIAIAINQLSRSGYFKGSTMIGHMVDQSMYLDRIFENEEPVSTKKLRDLRLVGYDSGTMPIVGWEEEARRLRELIGGKNRNAPESARAYMKMSEQGRLEGVQKKTIVELVR
jgi:DNA repair protein RadA/Sms